MTLLIKGLGLISVLLSKADGQIDSPPQCSQCKFYDDRCCQNRHDLQPDWMDRAANICPILISGMIIELLLSHLSKGLKQKCTQLLKPFVTVFHGLLWGMIHLNQSLSSRNHIKFLIGFWAKKVSGANTEKKGSCHVQGVENCVRNCMHFCLKPIDLFKYVSFRIVGSDHIYVKPGNDLRLLCGAGTNCLVGIVIILPQDFNILP